MAKRFYNNLYFYVLLSIAAGILLGIYKPGLATEMKPLGDLFIRLVKMMITPIVFTTVVTGIAGMENVKKAGRVGLKALLYFELATTFALVIGLLVGEFVQPGKGMNVDASTLDTKGIENYVHTAHDITIVEFLLNIIPANPVDAFAKGDILQVLSLAVLTGVVLGVMGSTVKPLVNGLELLSSVFFKIINVIMKIAPVGAFGAMAFTIGKYGLASLIPLAKLMACVYLTSLSFIFIVLGLIAYLSGFSILKFLRYIKEEILIVLGTSSSESVCHA